MRIIGLTGSIACGKSTVSRELTARGYPVIDGDQLSRQLTAPGAPLLPILGDAFPGCLNPDGTLNRVALGAIVFRDPEALRQLDDLMAAPLAELVEISLANARSSGAQLCFLEMPLLFEKGYDRYCDTVWSVWLPPEQQLARLIRRDGYTEEEALSRMRAVMSSDEKAAHADVVINNAGTPEETLAQLPPLLEAELAKAGSPRRRRSARYAEVPDPGAERPEAAVVRLDAAAMKLAEAPDLGVERPEAARRKRSARKAGWKLPIWLMIPLISLTVLLIAAFTAQCLMAGYLKQCADKHEAEARAVDLSYPLMYREYIDQYAAEYNLKPAFVAAIIRNESSFRIRAESAVGARGLMQLMPDTAEWIAHKLKIEGYAFERMFDPESNIRFGCWYLRYLSRLFRGDPVCVACAYHAGQGEIASWLSSGYSDDGPTLQLDRLPEGPTRQYAERVTRDYGIYEKKYYTPESMDSGSDPDAAAL